MCETQIGGVGALLPAKFSLRKFRSAERKFLLLFFALKKELTYFDIRVCVRVRSSMYTNGHHHACAVL